jgi:DNA-binding transcriptional ArsR family regulator
MEMEDVFHALADRHRRYLLDLLSRADGQTLTELSAHLPMSRFGAMKHLRVLEDAGLVRTRKVGREKLHYLNPAPLQQVAGWVEQYRRLWEERLDRLEEVLRELQQEQQTEMEQSNASDEYPDEE